MGQFDPGLGLCLVLVEQMHQCRGKCRRQLRLTLSFLGIETQLQHAAIIPVAPALQVFQQATGIAEATDNHLRQGRTVGREFEIENALGVA